MTSDLVSDGVRLRCAFLKAFLGLIGGLALLVVPPANASCQMDNIPEEFRPLDLSERSVNSLGNPVVGGPAASTIAERKCRDIKAAQNWYQTLGFAPDKNTVTLIEGVRDAYFSGGSWTYDLFSHQERVFEYPNTPGFDPIGWVLEHKSEYGISDEDLPAFGRVGSEREAHALLADIGQRDAALARLQRLPQPFRFFAQVAAAIPDVLIALFALGSLAVLLKAAFRRTTSGGSRDFNTSK